VSSRVEGRGYTASDKLDGVSCLYHRPTERRGDGATGRDVTRLLHPAIKGAAKHAWRHRARELVINVTDFESRFAGDFITRNLVAGCVNAKAPCRVLAARFVAYELIKPAGRLPQRLRRAAGRRTLSSYTRGRATPLRQR
jgi:hypothetical protein